ncbi:type VII secretion integral membrane protein EccD [Gordonia humi]|uniref:Type VII secretion integral membrane protein EccD n=1 Tax=Gordonia humi TaxID=686429 RepID=A0A840F5M6_9ACTN|nr:type VII secretion integral membrane protein EccD [Gordonia humi]MBB4135550.1 type VII secretion integral membrane protein EccD [Gordonia humi]
MTVVTGSVRISVVGGRSQVDVAVPADLPLAALLPDVLALLHVDDADRCWTLARIGDGPLATAQTLADADVHDGDLLILTDDPPASPGAAVDDVAAGVAALTRQTRREWTAESARWAAYAAAVTASVVSAAAGVRAACSGSATAAAAFTGAVALTLIVAALAGRRLTVDPRTCAALSICACVFGAAAAVAAAGPSTSARIALAGVAAGTIAVVGCRGTGTAPAAHTAVATAGAATAAIGALAAVWHAPASSIAAVAVAVGVVILALAGRGSIALARLPLPPVPVAAPPTDDPAARRSTVDGVDALGPMPPDPLGALADLALADSEVLARRTAAASSFLTGILGGATVFTVASVTVTAVLGAPDTVVLAYCAVASAALLIRGRVHVDRIQSAVGILGGAAAIAAVVVASMLTGSDASTPVIAMIAAAGLGAAGLGVGTVAAGREFSPLQVRAVEIAQFAVLIALIPLLLWVLDAYRLVREW